jgi:hypothetical protein
MGLTGGSIFGGFKGRVAQFLRGFKGRISGVLWGGSDFIAK